MVNPTKVQSNTIASSPLNFLGGRHVQLNPQPMPQVPGVPEAILPDHFGDPTEEGYSNTLTHVPPGPLPAPAPGLFSSFWGGITGAVASVASLIPSMSSTQAPNTNPSGSNTAQPDDDDADFVVVPNTDVDDTNAESSGNSAGDMHWFHHAEEEDPSQPLGVLLGVPPAPQIELFGLPLVPQTGSLPSDDGASAPPTHPALTATFDVLEGLDNDGASAPPTHPALTATFDVLEGLDLETALANEGAPVLSGALDLHASMVYFGASGCGGGSV